MTQNTNNLAQPTNFICGSEALNFTSTYCTSVNIPGISLNHNFLTNKSGSALNITGDNIMFNACSLSLLVDEDFRVYFELMNALLLNINPTNSTFATKEFDFFINVMNSKGNNLFKITLVNARISTIGDIQLDSTNTETEIVLNVDILFDYFELEQDGNVIPVLNA